MRADQIGLQLYTVRESTKDDMIGTLRRLGAMGYRAVEFAGFGNSAAAGVRAALDDLGMRAIADHVSLEKFETNAGRVFEDLHTIGASYAVVPWLPQERRTADGARRLADQLNRLGEHCRAEGLGLAYHNHDFEFAPLDGTDFMTILVEGTDPDLVKLELDVYWVKYAGRDPVELLGRYSGRVRLLHVKDMAPGEQRDMVVAGEGILPWTEILPAAKNAGAEWYIVEHDRPTDPLNDVERGLRNVEEWTES